MNNQSIRIYRVRILNMRMRDLANVKTPTFTKFDFCNELINF